MNKRIITLLLCIVLMLSAFSGCTTNGGSKLNSTSQLAVAVNPILLFDEAETVIAFNDIKNAIVEDQKTNSINCLKEETNWTWAFKKGDDWKQRNVYALEKWRNGDKVSSTKFSAYTFSRQGALAVMPFAAANGNFETFQNEELPRTAIAISVSGTEQEALCYKIGQDATMHIPATAITALASVDGVKAEFLIPGTNRTAVVSYILNERVIWQGELSSDATNPVTSVQSEELLNIAVKEGDLFFIAIQLDAKKQVQSEDELEDETPSDDVIVDNTTPSDDIIDDSDDKDDSDSQDADKDSNKVEKIPLMDEFDSTYQIIYPAKVTSTQKDVITSLRVGMVTVFDTDVLINTDASKEIEYELLIGKTNRDESKKVYAELDANRSNNGSDFIIRVVNKKIVIAANTDYALKLAVDYFMKNICKTDISTIASNYKFVYKPNLETIKIDGVNVSNYVIRTEKYPSLLTLRAAEALSEYIVSKTGYDLDIISTNDNTKYEILVGLTTASGISSTAFKSESLDGALGYATDDYKVYVKNKKLFIEAGSTYAANYATTLLIDAWSDNKNLTTSFNLSGKYEAGAYTLTGGYARTWGDEFLTPATSVNRKNWNVTVETTKGPWYSVDDPYYKASLASLNDSDPSNDFGGPWTAPFYDSETGLTVAQEGTIQRGNADYWLENNALVMQSKKTNDGYAGAAITTKGLMEFRYGILEARVIMGTKNGTASTYWTRSRDGGKWVNEFDLCENFGLDRISPNMHTWGEGGAYHVDHKKQIQFLNEVEPKKGEHFYDTYHYISMEWTPTIVNMYVDGNLYLSQEITTENWAAFAESTYVLFGSAAPHTNYNLWGTSKNPGNYMMEKINEYCENMYIDNVRVYQINSRQYSLRAKK